MKKEKQKEHHRLPCCRGRREEGGEEARGLAKTSALPIFAGDKRRGKGDILKRGERGGPCRPKLLERKKEGRLSAKKGGKERGEHCRNGPSFSREEKRKWERDLEGGGKEGKETTGQLLFTSSSLLICKRKRATDMRKKKGKGKKGANVFVFASCYPFRKKKRGGGAAKGRGKGKKPPAFSRVFC